jgi:hypothetical protein
MCLRDSRTSLAWHTSRLCVPYTGLCASVQVEIRYVLLEAAAGYALCEKKEGDEIGAKATDVQEAVLDFSKFNKMVSLKAFCPFRSAEDALENISSVAEGTVTETLRAFLEMNLPAAKPGKKTKFAMGVSEPRIGGGARSGTPTMLLGKVLLWVAARCCKAKVLRSRRCVGGSRRLPRDSEGPLLRRAPQ